MSESQFGQLKAMTVKAGDTADFFFNEIEGIPQLTCLPATNINKPFLNAVLKQSKEAARKARALRKVKGKKQDEAATDAAIARARKEDVELFVSFIVQGWEDVFNVEGEPVEFNEENCRDFLNAIPPEMFNDLRVFCLDIRNFRPDLDSMDSDEQEELSGN